VRRAALALVAAGAAATVLIGADGSERSSYRVDAVFDNAAFLIPGQDVKIAGSRVGRVTAVELTRERKARVEMEIEEGFAPFRRNATCAIRPQSLIGEKFVDCGPGTQIAPELRARDGDTPTVPLARTRSPVDLDLVFASLRRPYVERLGLVLSELGAGLAGRPEELEAAVRRANPALEQADRVLAIVNRDRAQLGRLVDRTDALLAELAGRDRDVARFVERAEVVGRAGAARRAELGRVVERLPALLEELEPSAERLGAVARDARPVVAELRAATPALRALWGDLGPLTEAGRPALDRLAQAAVVGRRAVRAARPVGERLRTVAVRLPPVVDIAQELVASLRSSGAIEYIQTFLYMATLTTARFDRVSHMAPSYQVTGPCQQWTAEPVRECDAHWAAYRGDRGGVAPQPPDTPESPVPLPRNNSVKGSDPKLEDRSGKGPGPSPRSPLTELPELPRLPGPPPADDLPSRLLDYLLAP